MVLTIGKSGFRVEANPSISVAAFAAVYYKDRDPVLSAQPVANSDTRL
jgi:hypothetical protein